MEYQFHLAPAEHYDRAMEILARNPEPPDPTTLTIAEAAQQRTEVLAVIAHALLGLLRREMEPR